MAVSDKPFWRWVADKSAAAGLTQARLAERLGVTAQTLASWKARNQFRRDLLADLAAAVNARMTAAQAAGRLMVQLIAPRDRPPRATRPQTEVELRAADAAYRRMEKAFARYASHTRALVRGLGPGGFFAFSACTSSPYEFEDIRPGDTLAEEMAQAVFRGALLLYIRPTPEGVAYYDGTWEYGRVVRHEDAKDEIKAFRRFVEQKLVAGQAAPQPQMTPDGAKAWLHTRLSQCYIHRSPMWMPGVGLGLVGWAHARDLKARVTISLPGGKFGGVLVYPVYNTLEYRFGRVLRRVVRSALTELDTIRRRAPSDDRVKLFHLTDGDDPMLPHTEEFYQGFDRLLRTVSSHEAPPEALDRAGPPDPSD